MKMQYQVTRYYGSSDLDSARQETAEEAARWAFAWSKERATCVYDLVTRGQDPMIARIGGDDEFVSRSTKRGKLFCDALAQLRDLPRG